MEAVDKVHRANIDNLSKVGIWGKGTNQVYRLEDEAEHFDGE